MPRKKKYTVCCSEPECQGGHSNRIHEVSEKILEKIPTEILVRISEEVPVYRCSYCGFVWGRTITTASVNKIVPLGFYDNSQNPNEFVPVPDNHRTR